MTTGPQPTKDVSTEGPPGLDADRLRPRLAAALQAAVDSLQFALIEGGRSNLTYRVTDGQRSWILRRPPLGHVLATAHDMSREYRVMDALHTAGFPVPKMVLQEPDPGLIGAPFFVMEMVLGPVITNAEQARALPATVAADAATDLIDKLVVLHGLDYERVGLADLGRPEGFMPRQIGRWMRQWLDSKAELNVPMAELAAILEANMPNDMATTLVHGDYRLENTILSSAIPGRLAAVIDWEMATLGDPLADLGLLGAYWDPSSAQVTGVEHATSANPGFPPAETLFDRYLEQTGRSDRSLPLSSIRLLQTRGHRSDDPCPLPRRPHRRTRVSNRRRSCPGSHRHRNDNREPSQSPLLTSSPRPRLGTDHRSIPGPQSSHRSVPADERPLLLPP